MNKKNVVGLICARGGSKGVPRKNLRDLDGVPLIVHTIRCGLRSERLGRLVVSTEDAEIADVARSYGAAVPFMRPVSLAQDDSSKWDVFRHVVQELERVEGGRIDVLADLDTGVPLRLPSDIDAAVELLDAADAEVVVTAYRSSRNPYFNMVEVGLDGFARVMKPLSSPVKNRQEAPQVYSLSPAVYAIRRDTLFKVDHWSRARMRLLEIDRRRAIDIDDNIDFEVVEYFLKNRSATP